MTSKFLATVSTPIIIYVSLRLDKRFWGKKIRYLNFISRFSHSTGAHQPLVYAVDVNILGRSVHTIKKNTEALVVASKAIGLEVNAGKTKYVVMSQDQDAGWSHDIKIDNSSIERVEEVKYLGTTLTNQNSIQEEIKNRLKSGNACWHSVWNLLSSSLLSENIRIKIYRTIILPVVLYGCETWSFTLRVECRLRVYENIWA